MNVYFTVDTECSMGGAWNHPERRPIGAARHVFCRIGNQEYGVPLLTRIMRPYGFRATYFVETLATRCVGEADTKSIFDFLLEQGQDVQLHIHPNFRYYSEWLKARSEGTEYRAPSPPDLIGRYSSDIQKDLLQEAIAYFEAFAGRRPTAFRAGCYAGSRSLLRTLGELGIRVDSSFNPCYHPDLSFPEGTLEPNVVQQLEGVWEIPITVARTRLPEGYNGFRFADCTSLSFSEIRTMLNAAAAAGQQHFVIVFHSFSAVKPRDETFAEFRPNRIVIRRLEKLFAYLARHSKIFRVTTMGEAAAPGALSQSPAPPLVELGFTAAAMRKAVQAVNNVYWV